MQLDHTHVVIRLRKMSEIGDLALIMLRRYPAALFIGFTIGALPWMIANAALLSWLPIQEANYGLDDDEAMVGIARYASWMVLLVCLQTPAAGVLTTLYLGQAVFEKCPTWASVIKETRRQFWIWFWMLGCKRLAIPIMIFLVFRYDQPEHGFWDVFVPICVWIALLVFRAGRPFLPEILMLEQCPRSDPSPAAITVSKRSRSLHSPVSGELNGKFLTVAVVLLWLWGGTLYALYWFRMITTGVTELDLVMLLVLFPLSLWMIAGFSVFVRLLCYLDTRIRLEGWEVELAIRAEAIRQFGEDNAMDLQRPRERSKLKESTSSAGKLGRRTDPPAQANPSLVEADR